MKKGWLYFINILIPLLVGLMSSILAGGMESFKNFNPPPLSPPPIAFPIVWTILYTLMGISMALVLSSDAPVSVKSRSVKIYALQLFFNFFWSILFFRFEAYFFSFLWIVALLVLIVLMIREFYKASKVAAYLQIPYLLWVAFATYLTFATFILSR